MIGYKSRTKGSDLLASLVIFLVQPPPKSTICTDLVNLQAMVESQNFNTVIGLISGNCSKLVTELW